ncbi:hypothetical protein CSKR_113828 [Clonorchis sinensis]|uniref:Uncharacterized protein n=1 Tax=Clonorchis sinensis TaxID=79923 RepID=A0A419PEA6_CLOSI|nr:hypothetical protein CSKR_113828 [Clonorchis sinensis]
MGISYSQGSLRWISGSLLKRKLYYRLGSSMCWRRCITSVHLCFACNGSRQVNHHTRSNQTNVARGQNMCFRALISSTCLPPIFVDSSFLNTKCTDRQEEIHLTQLSLLQLSHSILN